MRDKYQILKNVFGYDAFRRGQEAMIDAILKGQDCLGIMPTGAGKSICFQVPALCSDGIAIVVSPLISLMKDQVNTLLQAGVRGAYLNSSLTYRQYLKALENARAGMYKIIYVAPERLLTKSFLDFAKYAPISMVTVDEAHCVSQWGHDFRPGYLKIKDFIDALDRRPVVCAFTATATPEVKADIIRLLGLRGHFEITTGFDRDNLYFEVRRPKGGKMAELLRVLAGYQDKSGIIYCSTRKNVEEVCLRLKEKGIFATRYHAGLSDEERRLNQEEFLYDECNIMVATNAFGMGIDKSNVSFVIHYNMPKNMESYYQEAGRAGRDGSKADCIMLYSAQDILTNKYFIENMENDELDPDMVQIIKEREFERLNKMVHYCNSVTCLRKFILNYFGEKAKERCGNCANCLSDQEAVDMTSCAKQILNTVARTGQRFGIKFITDIVRGVETDRIIAYQLNFHDCFGCAAKLSAREVSDIINQLLAREFLATSSGTYPVLELTPRSKLVMEEKARILIRKTNTKKTKKSLSPRYDVDEELLNRLKEERNRIAKIQGVPAFVVFPDITLADMCAKLPQSEEGLLDVTGVGFAKMQRYGKRFLKILKEYKKG